MSNLIIIPARLESTRLPNKPLADIDGTPMIIHVLNRGLESACGDVVVATSNKEIQDIVGIIWSKSHHDKSKSSFWIRQNI